MSAPRFAVYYVPSPQGDLWRWGSGVVGYDAVTGTRVQPPEPGLAAHLTDDVQADPRRYGFHATLRAPFEPAPGCARADLLAAAEALALRTASLPAQRLAPSIMGGFIALTFPQAPACLQDLAADCVRTFEPFRAPLSEADRQRRLRAPLTTRQIAHLDAWGYPYVFDEFEFHMTLTGRLPDELAPAVLSALEANYGVVDEKVAIDGIAVFEQPSRDRPFRILERFAFSG